MKEIFTLSKESLHYLLVRAQVLTSDAKEEFYTLTDKACNRLYNPKFRHSEQELIELVEKLSI